MTSKLATFVKRLWFVLILGPLPFYWLRAPGTFEDHIRWHSASLQMLGLWLVYRGLMEMAERFKVPTPWAEAKAWVESLLPKKATPPDVSVHRDPRINGEEGKTTGRSVHRRSAIPFSSSEHPLSFHRSELRSKVRAMTATSRTGEKISSNRLAACAAHGCNRPFAVCGGCDRGRKFCSRVCANSARRDRCDELAGNIRQLLVVAACMQPGRLAIAIASAR